LDYFPCHFVPSAVFHIRPGKEAGDYPGQPPKTPDSVLRSLDKMLIYTRERKHFPRKPDVPAKLPGVSGVPWSHTPVRNFGLHFTPTGGKIKLKYPVYTRERKHFPFAGIYRHYGRPA